jgi:hypothetical protein
MFLKKWLSASKALSPHTASAGTRKNGRCRVGAYGPGKFSERHGIPHVVPSKPKRRITLKPL